MPQSKKKYSTSTNKPKTKKKNNAIMNELNEAVKFCIEHDSNYKSYSKLSEYKKIHAANPTIHMINNSFLSLFKISFINELLKKENKELRLLLHCGFLLTNLKEANTTSSFPAIILLLKHGFNTIYDIALENGTSVFLYTFLNKLNHLKIIKNADLFIMDLQQNPMYIALRKQKAIEELQVKGLFTRIKKFQL